MNWKCDTVLDAIEQGTQNPLDINLIHPAYE